MKIIIAVLLFWFALAFAIIGIMSFFNSEMGIPAGTVSLGFGALCVWGGVKLVKKKQKARQQESPVKLEKPEKITERKKEHSMGIADIFHISKFKASIEQQEKEIELLKNTINEMGAGEAITVKQKIEEYRQTENNLKNSCEEIRGIVANLQKEIEQKRNEVIVLDENIMLESFALYKPKFKFISSGAYKDRLDLIRGKQKEVVKDGLAAKGGENFTLNDSVKDGKKMIDDIKKLFVRSFNNECDHCVDNVKFSNIDASVKRIEKSFETINKLGKYNSVSLTLEYKQLKLEELFLAYEYQQKKEQEKEEIRAAREAEREQQKLEREIKEARERIAKEKKHFTAAIKELEEKLKNETDAKQIELITKNLEDAKDKFSGLEDEEKVVDYREQNAKAGFVYIISNIGAFGENIYKIGMTRRLEPMERVDELGGASVPFSFDVHAMIFSDNAPDLEAKLHEHFYSSRINKINDRKEFFRADLDEIEKVVKENYQKVVDIVKEAPAEQYRESLLVK